MTGGVKTVLYYVARADTTSATRASMSAPEHAESGRNVAAVTVEPCLSRNVLRTRKIWKLDLDWLRICLLDLACANCYPEWLPRTRADLPLNANAPDSGACLERLSSLTVRMEVR